MSQKSRRAVKRPVTKVHYKILAPSAFGFAEVGGTFASSPDHLKGRTVWVPLYSLTNQFVHQHIKLLFQIVRVEDSVAYTVFKGHDMARDYLRSLIRRGSSLIDGIFDVYTKDGCKLRVMVMVVTLKRARNSQKKAIRKMMRQVVESKAQQLGFNEYVQEMVLGKTASEIFNVAKRIYPLRKVEVRKSKTLELSPQLLAAA